MFNSHFKIPPISQDCNLRQTTQNNINNIINLSLMIIYVIIMHKDFHLIKCIIRNVSSSISH